jgi:hypothetical protein
LKRDKYREEEEKNREIEGLGDRQNTRIIYKTK